MTVEVLPRRAWAALAVLSLAAFVFVTAELMPIGLLTLMADDLDRSRSQVGLLVSGYAFVVVLASLPLTAVTQHIPRRRLLGVTLAVFTVGNVWAALAPSYPTLTGARLLTALTQALFWSIAPPTVTGLFPVAVRGRVVGLFSAGAGLAPVLGVPIGTWLGQQAGWRTSFAVLAVVGLASTAAVVALIPSYPPAAGGAARGTSPDRRAFMILLGATGIGITGFLTFMTYVTPFLLDVSGFTEGALAPLLFVSGASGVIGAVTVARTLDAHPAGSMLAALGVGAVSLLGLFALGHHQVAAVLLVAGAGFGYSAFATSMQARTLQTAPGSTDLASAGTSSAFNVGIAAGSLVGGLMLPGLGARPLALTGGLAVLLALTVLFIEARTKPPPVLSAEK